MASIGNYTRYVNPYVVVGGNEQVTKHYFSGTDRIVSRLSGSVSNFVDSTNLVDQHLTDLETRQTNDITLIFDEFGLGAVNISNQRADSGDCEVQGSCASTLYFFHPDHLGSSTFLSDETGQAYQFLLYLPWGESMAEQKAGGYGTPYKYTGKELDEEIGMYDYGARFYDPSISLWTSVDPLTEKYPSYSAYNYVMGNPIRYIDPDGMKVDSPDWEKKKHADGRITYTAEAGDSALSLYQQHGEKDGFTAAQANEMVEGCLGENYCTKEGQLNSRVEIDDVLTIYSDPEPALENISQPEPTQESEVPNFGIIGDLTGANAVMQDMDYALDVYEAEGLMPYIYAQMAIAHKEIGSGAMGRSLRNRVGRTRSSSVGRVRTTNSKSSRVPRSRSLVPVVRVSGQNRTIQTGSRGGKYYINGNGNKTYLNRDGTKRTP